MDQSEIKEELQVLKDRNGRVEAEKAWETSAARIGSIALGTYVIAGLALTMIGNDHPWRNALIPAIGYFLSTQSLPFLKKHWIARRLHER